MKLVFRIWYGLYRVLSSLWHRLNRRFTRVGFAVIGGVCVAFLTALDTDNTVGYQALTVLLLLLLVSMVFSLIFRARFSAVRSLPRFGTAGHPFSYRITVRNLTAKPQRGLTLLENLLDPRPTFSEWLTAQLADERHVRSFRFSQRRRRSPFRIARVGEAPVASMLPAQEAEVIAEVTPLRRGVLRFSGLTLARPDPLGLVRAFRRLPLPQTVLILPKRYVLPPLTLPGTTKYQEGGVAFALNVGQSEEFVALRDYRRGDPLRHIHWRSWAKAGKPIVKEFEDEFFVRHALVLDTFTDDPRSERFEEAVSVAASFACTILTQESLLDLMFVGTQAYCFTAGRGLSHTDHMLEILASVRACADRPFRELQSLVLDHAAIVSGCVCVLLAWDEERRQLVRNLRTLGVPVLVLVLTEAEQSEPLDPGPLEDDPEHFQVLQTGRIEEGLASLH